MSGHRGLVGALALGAVLLSVAASRAANEDPILVFDRSGDGGELGSSIADVDGDGWVETVSSHNDGTGLLTDFPSGDVGLGVLQEGSPVRDLRVADLDGDGLVDVITNCYIPLSGTDCRARFFRGAGDGTFVEDQEFASKNIHGYGETIVVADFDNDADLDVFITQYTVFDPLEQCYLLINDGAGHFVDQADAAGVSLRNRPAELRPEGAQALDFDGDGWIDLYVGSHFFMNNHDLTFTDRRAELGLPELFDEGAKFLDWNNDGRLDLIIHNFSQGPHLFEFDGTRFVERAVMAPASYANSFGVNAYDLDNDGREDVITAGGTECDTVVHYNVGTGFVRAPVASLDPLCSGRFVYADLDHDGRIDIVFHRGRNSASFINHTATSNRSFSVDVRGANGARNQFGRVLRASPSSNPALIYTRAVDGGSGYMSQSQYPVLVGTPYAEPHTVEIRYSDHAVVFPIAPGSEARVFPDGTVLRSSAGPPTVWVASARATEGRDGSVDFTVLLSAPVDHDVDVAYAVSDGTARAGRDYDSVAGRLTIPAGDALGTVSVPIRDDLAPETDETFSLLLSDPTGATLGKASAAGTIVDDDHAGSFADSIGFNRGTATSSKWRLRATVSGIGTAQVEPPFLYGIPGDVPVVGDWNRDGVDTVGVYRPAEHAWYLRNSNTTGSNDVPAILYGVDGDIPVVGDWDGDGIDTIGVYRPSEHAWYLRNSNTSGGNDVPVVLYGVDGDRPVVGDWDGDGIDTIGVDRSGEATWYLRSSHTSGPADLPPITYGRPGDTPIVGRWGGE